MRGRPDATTTTGSPSMTNTIDLAIWPGSTPSAAAASATVAVDGSSVFSSRASPSSCAASLTFERMGCRPCRGRCGADAYSCEGSAGLVGELFQARREMVREVLEVGHRVIVADQPEVDRAVVRHQRDAQTLVQRERHHRE